MRRGAMLAAAVVCAGLAVWLLAARAPAQTIPGPSLDRSYAIGDAHGAVARGQALFETSCSSCHGTDARGLPGRAPTLRGVGAAAVDWYVSTGRMPLARPGIEPHRAEALYDRGQIDELIAFVTSLPPGGGPPIPDVRPERGDVREGRRLFAERCAGCHQIMGQGGIGPGFYAPDLDKQVSPKDVGEALSIGPYTMPMFSAADLDPRKVDSLARYVTEVTASPPNRGGWGIGNLGPFPEGLVIFALGLTALLLVARVVGERSP